jgi:20S proteasome alpha/beta subunit
MTVCIAAMFNDSGVIGASDRMITAGDVQFQPQQTKIIPLSSSIVVTVAGDYALQVEIFQNVRSDVDRRIQNEPDNWWKVSDVADLYSHYYKQVKLKRAETAILAPLGLNNDTWISKQAQMAPQLITQIATELLNFEIPVVETIFAGIDTTGAHIYVADKGSLTCHDGVGFAAIGAGYWHADSQFMFAGHTRQRQLPETLLLTYSAKKRAEVAPGVGEATDMFMVSGLGSYTAIGDHVLDELEKIYKTTQQSYAESDKQANQQIKAYVEELARATTAKEQATITKDGDGDETVNKEKPRDPPENPAK